jgi:valyl-tRNA synthetase
MEISKTYNPAEVEDKWYQYWLDNQFFKSVPDEREPYTVVIPPPNVTGVLHMGHMLNNTIQDVLVRKARMEGKNACWVPGTDHASIATEAKVVAMLKEKGIEKKDLTREEFLKYAWEWKEKYGGIILEQLKKLGASCDWDRTAFTMDEEYSESVLEAFVDLYNRGLIYRGIRMVNWDPQGKTALSDEEVIYKDVQSNLYYTKYEIKDSSFENNLSDQIFAFYKKDSKGEEHTQKPFKQALFSDILVEIDGNKIKLSDLEVEKDGEIKKLGDLKIAAYNDKDRPYATFKFIDVLLQIQKIKNPDIETSQFFQFDTKVFGKEYITIATVRPETILGDTAICVNPNDERYKHLIGKKALVPIVNREIPIIADEYVTMDFGTGALKVTPAHDINDYELGVKHNLEVIDTIADDGTLNENCGVPKFVGKDRFAVRKEIAKDLEALGQLLKVEEYKNQVGTSERTGAVIEPKLSLQWFVKMKEVSKKAWDAVMTDEIKLYPAKFKNMYNHWMANVRDWCISRQLWWGHQIPAFYLPDGKIVVAKTKAEALLIANNGLTHIDGFILAAERGNIPYEDIPHLYSEADLRQDEDVLDTWASSWLWPISVFKRLKAEDNADIKYYYPTNDLVTAPEILFFWVARMIIAGYEFRGEKPFSNVYLTGIVRDQFGRKMSKQLGNSPDIFELMDKYSTDGVRYGILSSSAAGNDLTFDSPVPPIKSTPEEVNAFNANPDNLQSKLCETGRNFANKIWNAYRLVKGWEIDENAKPLIKNELAVNWFEAKFNNTLAETEKMYAEYRISEVLQTLYKLFWDDFCSWYLEMIKPSQSQAPSNSPEGGELKTPPLSEGAGVRLDRVTFDATIQFFDKLLKVLHPFMPFITEEIWQDLKEAKAGESICIATYPKSESIDNQVISEEMDLMLNLIVEVRNIRNQKQISPREALDLHIRTSEKTLFEKYSPLLQKMANLENLIYEGEKPKSVVQFLIKQHEFYVPIQVNVEEEKARLQKDLEYQIGFRDSTLKKLSNEKFVANAKPEIVANERQKLADAEAKIKSLEESLASL